MPDSEDRDREFIANASHELRTPITIIRGFAEMLCDMPEVSQATLRDIAGKLVRTSVRLEKLVRSLLSLSDVEQGSTLHFREVYLNEVAEHCLEFLQTVHPEARVELKGTVKTAILADPDLLDMAIMNLLENAVKYSEGIAHIQVTVGEREGEVFLEVADQGLGIPEKDLPHIFERFYTVDKARSRRSGGAGLGLSIVKTVMEKHGGQVSVKSVVGSGSCFSLIFTASNAGKTGH